MSSTSLTSLSITNSSLEELISIFLNKNSSLKPHEYKDLKEIIYKSNNQTLNTCLGKLNLHLYSKVQPKSNASFSDQLSKIIKTMQKALGLNLQNNNATVLDINDTVMFIPIDAWHCWGSHSDYFKMLSMNNKIDDNRGYFNNLKLPITKSQIDSFLSVITKKRRLDVSNLLDTFEVATKTLCPIIQDDCAAFARANTLLEEERAHIHLLISSSPNEVAKISEDLAYLTRLSTEQWTFYNSERTGELRYISRDVYSSEPEIQKICSKWQNKIYGMGWMPSHKDDQIVYQLRIEASHFRAAKKKGLINT